MIFKPILAGLAAALAVASVPASADVLYSNGPVNGQLDAFTINFGYAVSNSFVLGSASTVTGVDFSVWSAPGDTFNTVDWGITNTIANYVINGTAAVTSGAGSTNSFGYNIFTASISLPNVSLGAGTWYIVLQNAVTSGGNPIFWDENNGPSSASQLGTGDLAGYDVPGSTGSETFSILGTTGAVPEPATWAMMISGFALAGGAMRRRHATKVSFA